MNKMLSSVLYKIHVAQDDSPVRGNLIDSGDKTQDRADEDLIIQRLENGEVWAWACIQIIAYIPGIEITGNAILGACSYEDEKEFKESSDYQEMCEEAKADLIERLSELYNQLTQAGFPVEAPHA